LFTCTKDGSIPVFYLYKCWFHPSKSRLHCIVMFLVYLYKSWFYPFFMGKPAACTEIYFRGKIYSFNFGHIENIGVFIMAGTCNGYILSHSPQTVFIWGRMCWSWPSILYIGLPVGSAVMMERSSSSIRGPSGNWMSLTLAGSCGMTPQSPLGVLS